MKLNLSDDKEYWNQQVHLPDQVLVRAKILHYLVAPGIEENKMSKVQEIKEAVQQLEALTGKKVMFKENNGLYEVGETTPTEPEVPEAPDNAERFENAMSLNGALQKQIESALGVIAAKQQQQPDSSRYLSLIARANKGLEQIVRLLENPGQETEIAEMQLSDIQNEGLEGEILEVEGEPIQVYFPKGTRDKLRARAKRSGKFTISDYIRSQIRV
jgi:hypothetical protein